MSKIAIFGSILGQFSLHRQNTLDMAKIDPKMAIFDIFGRENSIFDAGKRQKPRIKPYERFWESNSSIFQKLIF